MNRQSLTCPGCQQVVVAINGRYDTHHRTAEARYCFMSGMPQPVEGREPKDMLERARIVACLATEVQDSDPHAVWEYLSVMPREFVQELLQIALAGMGVDGKRVSDVWWKWDIA